MKLRLTILALAFFSLLVSVPGTVQSCSGACRAGASGGPVMEPNDGLVPPLQDKMWVFPRGMERDGATPHNQPDGRPNTAVLPCRLMILLPWKA